MGTKLEKKPSPNNKPRALRGVSCAAQSERKKPPAKKKAAETKETK